MVQFMSDILATTQCMFYILIFIFKILYFFDTVTENQYIFITFLVLYLMMEMLCRGVVFQITKMQYTLYLKTLQ